MIKVFSFIIACVILICPVFGTELETESESIESSEVLESEESSIIVETEAQELVPVGDPVRSVSPVTPSNTTGLKKILLELFGNYDTIVTIQQYQSGSSYYSTVTNVQEDYPWLASAAIFFLIVWCLFRLLGGVLVGRSK